LKAEETVLVKYKRCSLNSAQKEVTGVTVSVAARRDGHGGLNRDCGDRGKKETVLPSGVSTDFKKLNGRRAILPARHLEEVIMAVEECIQNKTNIAEKETPNAPVTLPAVRFDEAETISSLSPTRSVYIIDFFETRNRLPAELEDRPEELETNLRTGQAAAPPLPSIGQMDRFEESLYWLVSAATLIYLLFMIVTS
jgi:hypothetical protein